MTAVLARTPPSREWLAPVVGLGLAAAILHAPPTGPLPLALAAAATGALVVWIVWQDLSTFTISDAALVSLAVVAVAYRWSGTIGEGEAPGRALAAMAVDVTLCGGFPLLFREAYYRLKGVDGLGLGDVKLAAAGALLVGGVGFSWALLAASLAGLVAVAGSRLVRPARARAERIAFGALLAPALWGVWLIGQALPRLGGG